MRVGRPTLSTSQVCSSPSARSCSTTYVASKTPGAIWALGLMQRTKQQLLTTRSAFNAFIDAMKVCATVGFLSPALRRERDAVPAEAAPDCFMA
eukprot:8911231-Prorocentrum_lima.AAC.1